MQAFRLTLLHKEFGGERARARLRASTRWCGHTAHEQKVSGKRRHTKSGLFVICKLWEQDEITSEMAGALRKGLEAYGIPRGRPGRRGGADVSEPASSFLGTNIVGLYSTCASPVVPHLSTRHAHGCLASEIGRDPAFPTRFDRTENSCEVTSLVIASGHSAQEHT